MSDAREEKPEDEEEVKEFIPKPREQLEVDVGDLEAEKATLHSDNLDYSGKQVCTIPVGFLLRP